MVEAELDTFVNCLICSNLMCKPVTLNCGHSFCRSCTIKWCYQYKNYNCPVCRKKLDSSVGTTNKKKYLLPRVNVTLNALIDLIKLNKRNKLISKYSKYMMVFQNTETNVENNVDDINLDDILEVKKCGKINRSNSSSSNSSIISSATTKTECLSLFSTTAHLDNNSLTTNNVNYDNNDVDVDDDLNHFFANNNNNNNNNDSTLSRLNIFNLPIYLSVTLFYVFLLFLLKILKGVFRI